MLEKDPKAFPPAPPASLDDARAVLEADWSAFTRIGRMSDHWDRPGWTAGHRAYYWMVTFAGASGLVDEALSCQNALAELAMDPVPADGLHITMAKIGNRGQVTGPQLGALAGSVRGTLGRPFRLLAHPMAGSRGAIRFTLTPWTELVALHAALTQAGTRAGVPGGRGTPLFRPHLGILYNNRDREAATPIQAVAALRSRSPVELTVNAVQLVELRRDARAYRWDTLHELALDGAVQP
ncbi:2'-5' RNA ligase family protein [Streptomyces spororaveus]|uniref:2'-5' RNA ligase family protein n=1 Tax=Streptomyces spororaveus TaxID=284039 RepID=UPI0037A809A1